MKTLITELGDKSYPIAIGSGILARADELFRLDRRVLIVTDDGAPNEYAQTIASLCKSPTVVTVKSGEDSKSLDTLEKLLLAMQNGGFDRGDCAVAVGGGVVGDLTGFAASVYMRGVDFYNVPTTLLSQVDSSIGGKTAVNLGGVKNTVGTFYQPKAVLIDTDVLTTLPRRQMANGLAEAIKMSLTSDAELFRFFETSTEEEIYANTEDVILGALRIKKDVVEKDEKETGLRRVLNFGHTLGHGIEASQKHGGLYHGECVALGMLPMCASDVRARLCEVLKKVGLPHCYEGDISSALDYVSHDKKCSAGSVRVIRVETVGEFTEIKMTIDEFKKMVLEADF